MVTGFDLVRAQLLVAGGERLPFTQSDITVSGHAMECRIYAEDSVRLLPQSGRLLRYREPSGEGVRVDGGVVEGQTITVHYDPLLAKLIVHGATRDEVVRRMVTALRAYEILGIRHNVPFLIALLTRPEVARHDTHTRFIEEHMDALVSAAPAAVKNAAAAIAAFLGFRGPTVAPAAADGAGAPTFDPWQTLGPIVW
jgi:acetyl/propionyl-CoA carboxylase alpha subunit